MLCLIGPYKVAESNNDKYYKMAASMRWMQKKCHRILLRRVTILASNHSFTNKVDNKQRAINVILLSYVVNSFDNIDSVSFYYISLFIAQVKVRRFNNFYDFT